MGLAAFRIASDGVSGFFRAFSATGIIHGPLWKAAIQMAIPMSPSEIRSSAKRRVRFGLKLGMRFLRFLLRTELRINQTWRPLHNHAKAISCFRPARSRELRESVVARP